MKLERNELDAAVYIDFNDDWSVCMNTLENVQQLIINYTISSIRSNNYMNNNAEKSKQSLTFHNLNIKTGYCKNISQKIF